MNYNNAEPKILKTLKSDGNVVNESKEVINPTSDYWKTLYDQTEPKVDKILHSDGTITDSDNNLIQDTNEFNVQKYNQAEPIPAKYLHSDGTIDENPGGGSGADLEDNHQTTIDVSTYTEPVEIEPSSGKDGMKKATVTLSNIPSGGVSKLYAWTSEIDESFQIYTIVENPGIGDMLLGGDYNSASDACGVYVTTVDSISDNKIYCDWTYGYGYYYRDNTKDVSLV